MLLANINPPKQLIYMSFIGKVSAEDLAASHANVTELLTHLKPGFRVLTDLSQLEAFGPDCAREIGHSMALLSHAKVGLVVRVIPDESKDFGLNILAHFHYAPHPRIVTCASMAEAAKALAL